METAHPPEKGHAREGPAAGREAVVGVKGLRFKPWSGRDVVVGETIEEEIEGIE